MRLVACGRHQTAALVCAELDGLVLQLRGRLVVAKLVLAYRRAARLLLVVLVSLLVRLHLVRAHLVVGARLMIGSHLVQWRVVGAIGNLLHVANLEFCFEIFQNFFMRPLIVC